MLRAGQQLTLLAKRLFYLAIIAADIEYGSNAFYSSLSTSSKEKLIRLSKRGVRAIFRAPPWTPSLPLYQQLQICRLPQRMDYKLLVFTYRCTHSLTSTLLTNEFSVLGQSNARTRSITRVNLLSLFPCPTSVTALVQSLLSLLAHFCGTLCRLLCGIPMLNSLDLGTPLPLTWDSL